MADKILNYVEFRYEDGQKQVLRGKDAQDWMEFTKKKLAIAHTVDQTYNRTWTWERFDAETKIPNRPGVEPAPPKPKPVADIGSEYDGFY